MAARAALKASKTPRTIRETDNRIPDPLLAGAVADS